MKQIRSTSCQSIHPPTHQLPQATTASLLLMDLLHRSTVTWRGSTVEEREARVTYINMTQAGATCPRTGTNNYHANQGIASIQLRK